MIEGDFIEKCKEILDNSVDLIFTDPPYQRGWLPFYEPLGKIAFRVLKEGGSLVMYAGHYGLPQIFDYMENSGLKYWWVIMVKHTGSSARMFHRNVLVTYKPLLWFTKGTRPKIFEFTDDSVESQRPDDTRTDLLQKDKRSTKKNMVVLYDGGDHSDLVLKATSWLEHSGKFNVYVLTVNKKREVNPTEDAKEFEDLVAEDNKRKEYLEQVGFEFNEIYLSEETGKSSEKSADLILSAVNASQPDLVVSGATIGKFSFFNNSHFLSLLDQLSCPIVIARQFTFPGVHRVKAWFLKLIRK